MVVERLVPRAQDINEWVVSFCSSNGLSVNTIYQLQGLYHYYSGDIPDPGPVADPSV